jgi:hypothetical protein
MLTTAGLSGGAGWRRAREDCMYEASEYVTRWTWPMGRL